MNKHYQPIETPFPRRLREFRHQVLPAIVFIGVGLIVTTLWRGNISEPGFIGKVVADSAYINSPVTGIIEVLNTDQFDYVYEGDPIAVIQVADSSYLQSRLNVIRAQIDFINSSMAPISDHQRNLLNLEGLKLERAMLEAELASLIIRKEFAENDFQKAESLFEDDMISELEFSDRQTQYLALQEEVNTKQAVLSGLEQSIGQMNETLQSTNGQHAMEASVHIQNSLLGEILEEMKPVILRSPLSGVISSRFKNQGEVVTPGEPLVKVESVSPNYIVGYIRQPLTVQPEPGLPVEIRTRSPKREFYMSEILAVGGHIVPIEPAMQRPGAFHESGLPVKIALSGETDYPFLPGELVDLVLRRGD